MSDNKWFQALHAPIGANAYFALGSATNGGGFGLEAPYIPKQDIHIGIKDEDFIECFPFYQNDNCKMMESFVKNNEQTKNLPIRAFPLQDIVREYGYATDVFTHKKIKLELINPIHEMKEKYNTVEEWRNATAPCIIAKITVDNTACNHDVDIVFAVSPIMSKMKMSDYSKSHKGIFSKDGYGFAIKETENIKVTEFMDFDLAQLIKRDPIVHTIAPMGGLLVKALKNAKTEIYISIGWFKGGIVTAGKDECSYAYASYFKDLVDVLTYGCKRADAWYEAGIKNNELLKEKKLTADEEFLISHSVKSYYASTMLLKQDDSLRWVVNEGTFMMMNTFDLTVDHAFFELELNPWVVRNQLDSFLEEYSYIDQCGISFTHDQGTHNVFSNKGTSSYEIPNINGCFSYMAQEQLCNWILAAAMYVNKTNDVDWLILKESILIDCFNSMKNRDSLDGNYDGVMDVDSSKCGVGTEITTYDSLDTSLGQSRRNLYIAVKCWASYIALEHMLTNINTNSSINVAKASKKHSLLCAKTIVANYNHDLGYIPALFEGNNSTAIIPAIEALVYPYFTNENNVLSENGDYGELIKTLKLHIENIYKQRKCYFENGGMKLSDSSYNSWISKIFICQCVMKNLLDIHLDYEKMNRAHVSWWKNGCGENPGIDQIFSGKTDEIGFHYPRAVTSVLLWKTRR